MADSTVKYLNKLTWLRAETKDFVLCYTQEEYTPTPSSLGDIIDYHRSYPSLPTSPNPPAAVYLCLPLNSHMIVDTDSGT